MRLFRSKRKTPEVNYFKGGVAWTNYTWTVSRSSLIPPDMVAIVGQSGLYSYDYSGNITALKPYSLELSLTNATLLSGNLQGITDSNGMVPALLLGTTGTGTQTITFKNCFENKVFTITVNA